MCNEVVGIYPFAIKFCKIAKYLPFSQLHVAEFQIKSFSYILCFLRSHQLLSLFHFGFQLYFLPSNLYFHSHDISFVNVFDSFIP